MTEQEKAAWIKEKCRVTLAEGALKAYVNLPAPTDEIKYSISDIQKLLLINFVVFGVKEEVIENILRERIYGIDVLIAEGIEKTDGKDGYFEYLFDVSTDGKPKVLEDGSVDYRTLRHIETVSAGQEIIRYTKSMQGKNGKDVCGRIIQAKNGREQSLVKGKGFHVNEERTVYIADITGKIEVKDGKVNIYNILEFGEDIDYLSGDINFNGDVVVRGNVTPGMTLQATGTITVFGHVESASIISGKDVVLQNGMQGAGKGRIECKGNLSGKFFEQTMITAGGNVNANSILNCVIDAAGDVTVFGKLGIIVGGNVRSGAVITATIIGNMAEVKTELLVGVTENVLAKISSFEEEAEEVAGKIQQIDTVLAKLNEMNDDARRAMFDSKKKDALRTKIGLNTRLAEINRDKQVFLDKIERSKGARIIVTKRIYPGTRVIVNGVPLQIKELMTNITIKRKGEDVCLFSNES